MVDSIGFAIWPERGIMWYVRVTFSDFHQGVILSVIAVYILWAALIYGVIFGASKQ